MALKYRAVEEPTLKEVEEAVRYLEELRKDPEKFEKWVDRVIEGWMKRKSSRRLLQISKKH